jgi:hypothetical protein
MKKLALLIAVLFCSTAIAQQVTPLTVVSSQTATPLVVLPSSGKAVAVVRSTSVGRWFVLSATLQPIQTQAFKLTSEAGGGSIIFWEGVPGSRYTALFVPDSITEPLAAATVILGGDPTVPPIDPPLPNQKVTAVTYVYEKDDGPMPKEVASGLAKLNSSGVFATEFEEDTTDKDGQVPEQAKVALEAAKKSGLPALVVQYSSGSPKVIKNPKTEASVLEAVK